MPAQIEFQVVAGRSPAGRAPQRSQGAPLRIMVLGAFGGRAQPRSLAGVMPQRVDIDHYDAVLARMAGDVQLALAGAETVHYAPRSLDDLEPDALYQQLPLFRQLRELRARLASPASFEQAAAELRALQTPGAPGAPGAADAAPPAAEPDEDDRSTLERLLGGPATPAPHKAASSPATSGLQGMLRDIVAPHVVWSKAHLQQPLIESVDRAASHTLRALLRHPQWREFESNWLAVDRLLRNVDDDHLVVELLDVRADELLADLQQAQGDVSRTALASTLAARAQHDSAGSWPGLWVALHDFGNSAADLAVLAGLGTLAAQGGGAVLAGAAASLVGTARASEPGDPRDWAAAGEAWQALRSSGVARNIGLVFPRLIGRLPYGPRTLPVSALGFDELADGFEHERLAWQPAALDLARLLAQGHAAAGWDFDPADHCELDELPAYVDRSGPEPRLQAVAECYLSERQQQALHGLGIMPLLSDRQQARARLGRWHSIASGDQPLAGPWAAR